MNKQKIDINKINKVVSFGCSFSDYMFGTEITYGEQISKIINAEYIHQGVGAGSNHRIWRRFFDFAQKGFFNETTLVTIQWTHSIRTEVFVGIPPTTQIGNTANQDTYSKETGYADIVNHHDGFLMKYKHDSWKWHTEGYTGPSQLMKLMTDNTCSEEWAYELTTCYNFNISEYCKNHNIPLVFIDNHSSLIHQTNDPFFNSLDVYDFARLYPRTMKDGRDDFAHMSTEGHILLADRILKKITKL